MVPWSVFWLWADAAAAREAFVELQQFGAVCQAIALTFGKDEAQARAQQGIEMLKAAAFPGDS